MDQAINVKNHETQTLEETVVQLQEKSLELEEQIYRKEMEV